MAQDSARETLGFLAWRLTALGGIVAAVALMLSSDSVDVVTAGFLTVPVDGVEMRDLVDSFSDPRDGDRVHRAIDIPAPRGTPVIAAASGPVRRIFSSASGGLGVYQIDESGTRCLYYAHLDGYVSGLREGKLLSQGDILGYVGTTGNAPDDVPHLHFEVLSLGESGGCAEGRPLNPHALFR